MCEEFSKSNESPIRFYVHSFEAKNRVFEFDHQQMNTLEFV